MKIMHKKILKKNIMKPIKKLVFNKKTNQTLKIYTILVKGNYGRQNI